MSDLRATSLRARWHAVLSAALGLCTASLALASPRAPAAPVPAPAPQWVLLVAPDLSTSTPMSQAFHSAAACEAAKGWVLARKSSTDMKGQPVYSVSATCLEDRAETPSIVTAASRATAPPVAKR